MFPLQKGGKKIKLGKQNDMPDFFSVHKYIVLIIKESKGDRRVTKLSRAHKLGTDKPE